MNEVLERLKRIEYMLEVHILPEFLTVAESAKLLRCGSSKIRSLLNSGDLQFNRIGESVKSTILIKRKELLKQLK
jgi:excisionase family DNA binding protein